MGNIEKELIENWVSHVIKEKRWELYDDLHIDSIAESNKRKQNWITAGLNCLDIAKDFLMKEKLTGNFVATLGYSLVSKSNPIGINFLDAVQFVKQFDHSPPSLYIFKRDWNNWLEQVNMSERIKIVGINNYECLYLEYLPDGSMDYRRSVFIL